jgi:hypothetical protein
MKKISAICILMLLVTQVVPAQMTRDQDLVTLKNGYQVLGYIIEQQPGKVIRIYRPEANDTVETKMEDISKLNKIWVETYATKEVSTVEAKDSIEFGRYNNKRNVILASTMWQVVDIEYSARKGIGLGYYRSFNNRYWLGLSSYFLKKQNPSPNYAGVDETKMDFALKQMHFNIESKWRLALRQQNRRLTTLLALNAGYVMDQTTTRYEGVVDPLGIRYEEATDGFMFQTGLAFRINPDNNSGFIIEPGYSYFPQNIRQYNGLKGDDNTYYLGHKRVVNHMFTLKLGYFF